MIANVRRVMISTPQFVVAQPGLRGMIAAGEE
jgi:hypothetical protein